MVMTMIDVEAQFLKQAISCYEHTLKLAEKDGLSRSRTPIAEKFVLGRFC